MKKLLCLTILSGFLSNCAAGFPPKLNFPQVNKRAQVIRIEGFDTKGNTIPRVVSVRKDGQFKLQDVEIPRIQAKFIDLVEGAKVADYYVLDGDADYTIVGTQVYYKGGVHGITTGWIIASYFLMGVPMIFPWGDSAHAKIEVKIYDDKNRLVEHITEHDGIVYGMWWTGVLADHDYKRSTQIRDALLERAAVRSVEAIEKDMARK